MATLIRFAPRAGAAIDPRQDLRFDGDVAIGRAAGCELRLQRAGVQFRHAILREENGALVLLASAGAMLTSHGRTSQHVSLAAPGDEARIGPFLLTLAPPAPGGDHTVIVTPDAQAATPDEADIASWYSHTFAVSLPNVRLLAFALCCVVAALFFILPLAFAPGQLGAHTAAASDRALAIGVQASTAPAQIDALWNVGAFSTGHSAFGGNCAHCHQAAFVHIPSAACLNCHRDIGQHANPAIAPAADLRSERCETCHHEHKGPVMATADRQADCVACHAVLHDWAPHTSLANVRDFGSDHPQFAPALVQDATLHTTRRVLLGGADVPDASGLRFTHAKHLALDSLNQAGSAACAQCHIPLPGGVTFAKVEFDTACARCHTLQFEPRHPEWRLPHGHPDEVASRIAGFYAGATLAGERFAAPRDDLFAKPGAPLPPPPPAGTVLVSNEVAAAMMSSIARSACGQCHVVSKPVSGAPDTAWTVAPVFVNDRFLPASSFSHASHATSACATCHAAKTSDGGPLALLPGIATCRLCHVGESGAPQRVASTCVSCHMFHDPSRPLMPSTAVTPMRDAFAENPRSRQGGSP